MQPRDIPFDEEVTERSAPHREAFGEPAPLAEVETMRRRWADVFNARATAEVRCG